VQVFGGRTLVLQVACRVLIANQQPIVRHGLRALLANEPDLEVVREADNGRAAVQLAHELRPDVVVIDLLTTLDRISATRMIRAELPETQVIVMAGLNEGSSAIESIRAGAAGYGRWLLPWIAVVLTSATLAYAINSAIAGDPSAGDKPPDVRVAVPTAKPPESRPSNRPHRRRPSTLQIWALPLPRSPARQTVVERCTQEWTHGSSPKACAHAS